MEEIDIIIERVDVVVMPRKLKHPVYIEILPTNFFCSDEFMDCLKKELANDIKIGKG